MSVSKKLNILMVSSDCNIFKEGSEEQERMKEYASVVGEFTIIVFTKHWSHFTSMQLASNLWVHPTNSWSKWFYVSDTNGLVQRLFGKKDIEVPTLVTTQDPFECGLAGYLVAKSLRIPLHLQIHTDFLNRNFAKGSLINFFRVRLAKYLLRKHMNIQVMSEKVKMSIFDKISFPINASPRIEVFPLYVDREKFRKAEDTVHLSQKYLGLDLIVLVVASLEKEYNVELAIKLIYVAKNRNPELIIGLVIVGGGSQRKYLEKLANLLRIGDRVFFEGENSDPSPYYKSADLLLSTSLFEGYGRMLAEATASGCMVVTRDVGAAKEIVTQSSGIVCGEEDEECLIHNIMFLANSMTVRNQLKNSARTVSEREVFQTKEEYLSLYKELLLRAALNDEFIPFS